jgi:predicted protein tyrosine phosphatase
MKVIALSRALALWMADQIPEPHVIVSIIEPHEAPLEFVENKSRLAILSLNFYDLDYNPERWGEQDTKEIVEQYGHGIFTPDQAKQIVDFVEEWKKKAQMIMVHCSAGVSRSAGVAGAISLVLNGKDEAFFKGRYIPNRFVYRTILNEWERRK